MKALHRQAGRGRSTIKTAAVLLAGALITATTPPTYGAAITFTDWTRVDTTDDVAEGLLGPVTVTLSGGNVSFSWEAFPGFSFPFFTPALAMSEAVELGGPNPPTTYSYTVSFSTPVSNPRIHIGSLASTLVFSAPLVRVSGQADFVVTGDVLSGAFHEHSIPTDSNGTIELPGWFSSFTFTAQALQPFNPFDGIVIQIGATDPCAQGETPQISVEHSASGTWLSWVPLEGWSTHDLVRGDLALLRSSGGSFTQALDGIDPGSDVCMANDTPVLTLQDTRPDPLPDNGWFYLVRSGECTYNSESLGQLGDRDHGIRASSSACP